MIMIRPLKHSAGIALVTVLLIVAAATIATVSISSRLQIDIRRTENLLRSDQAWLHMISIEEEAKYQLVADAEEDARSNRVVDDTGEVWYETLENFSVEGGGAKGDIVDEQGLYNLNNLVKWNDAAKEWVVNPAEKPYFERLLDTLSLPKELADAVVDWLDTNRDPGLYGAEDSAYQTRTDAPPYNTANSLMVHRSELLLVAEFTPAIYDTLAPFVTALPGVGTKINVNTAPKEVLKSLADGIEDADELYNSSNKPWPTVDAFIKDPALAGLGQIDTSRLSVTSNYFSVWSDVKVGKSRVVTSTLLQQQDPPVNTVFVLQRMREDLYKWPTKP